MGTDTARIHSVEPTRRWDHAAEGGGQARVTEAHIVNVDANSVTLAWSATTSATRFKITYTENGINFNLVSPPPGYSTYYICELRCQRRVPVLMLQRARALHLCPRGQVQSTPRPTLFVVWTRSVHISSRSMVVTRRKATTLTLRSSTSA